MLHQLGVDTKKNMSVKDSPAANINHVSAPEGFREAVAAKAKPVARQGRKATGLASIKIAGLPGRGILYRVT
jgi:hypothetical protein